MVSSRIRLSWREQRTLQKGTHVDSSGDGVTKEQTMKKRNSFAVTTHFRMAEDITAKHEVTVLPDWWQRCMLKSYVVRDDSTNTPVTC